jgi:DNA-binding transcriptional MerR regulator
MSQKYYYRQQIVELFDCEEEFLDELEAEELVCSVEVSSERERVFPEDQVERIRVINNLVRDLEVNLPGAEVILEMRENMMRMQQRFDQILQALLKEFRGRVG